MTPLEVAIVLCAAGTVFFFGLATLGLFRLPDVFSRAHATSKADTLGTLFALAAAGLAAESGQAVVRLVFLLSFVLVTTPTATHAIVRAAASSGDGVPTTTGPDDRAGERGVDDARTPGEVETGP